ncbi:opacity protein-like surface antigen [Dyella sp. SG562]|uniref:outer membrane beta-barrel protein n=1 Tax=Dyella sp. SG562 TaxID=2587017 RepID=UPI001422F943|nr:outer membrane beta-barrel protein [Dyella sp. SG562]NII74168.1 opacity protein-like surface antigen [Dyella sp. SG562]
MRKEALLCTIAVALLACGTAQAASDGQFYLGASAGQSSYRALDSKLFFANTHTDRQDLGYGLRFGYRWSGPVDVAVESGFVDLGRMALQSSYRGGLMVTRAVTNKMRLDTKAVTLGLAGRYVFGNDQAWLVSARGGLLRGYADVDERSHIDWYHILDNTQGSYASSTSHTDTYTSWYAGIGIGYRFTPQLSLSLTYDSYRVKARFAAEDLWPALEYRHWVGLSSLYLEYSY